MAHLWFVKSASVEMAETQRNPRPTLAKLFTLHAKEVTVIEKYHFLQIRFTFCYSSKLLFFIY